jgi:hypothetical protein
VYLFIGVFFIHITIWGTHFAFIPATSLCQWHVGRPHTPPHVINWLWKSPPKWWYECKFPFLCELNYKRVFLKLIPKCMCGLRFDVNIKVFPFA